MKAIRALKIVLKDTVMSGERAYLEECIKELETMQDIILEKEEALEIERFMFKNKLEELNNRSCDSCRTIHCPVRRILVENEYITSSYFYCNDWEIKENK